MYHLKSSFMTQASFFKIGFTMLFLFHLSSGGSAQTINWNPVLKIDDNFHQMPVGVLNDEYFLLTGNSPFQSNLYGTISSGRSIQIGRDKLKLIKYNSKLDAVTEKPLEFRNEMDIMVDAYVSEGNIHLVYFDEKEFLRKRVFNSKLEEIKVFEISLAGRKKPKKFSAINADKTQRYTFGITVDKKFSAVCINNQVEILDAELKSVGNISITETVDEVVPLFAKNRFFFVGLQEETKKATIYSYDIAGKQLDKYPVENTSTGNWDHQLWFEASADKLHYFDFSGNAEKNLSRKGFLERKLANRINHVVLTPALKKETAETISLEKYVDKKGKNIGIDDAYVEDVFFNDGIDIVITPYTKEYSDVVKMDAYNFTDLYFLKIKNGQLVNDVVIKRSTWGGQNYSYLFGTAIMFRKNKYVVLTQDGSSRYDLKKTVLDPSFKILSSETIEIYKQQDYYLALDEYLKVSDGRYLFWGRYRKNTGSAFVTID
jgi:hypothetical protein